MRPNPTLASAFRDTLASRSAAPTWGSGRTAALKKRYRFSSRIWCEVDERCMVQRDNATPPPPTSRFRSHCRFRNTGTEYALESGLKWMQVLLVPHHAHSAGSAKRVSENAAEPHRLPCCALGASAPRARRRARPATRARPSSGSAAAARLALQPRRRSSNRGTPIMLANPVRREYPEARQCEATNAAEP
jgi:hypothetical protein